MAGITFTWDARKERENRRKHGVWFDEARSIFLDENAKLIGDPDHSDDEDRFVLLGLSYKLRLLVVCHTAATRPGDSDYLPARRTGAKRRNT